MDGKVLGQPISGNGQFKNILENVRTTISFKLAVLESKNGKTFVKPDKMSISYDIEK